MKILDCGCSEDKPCHEHSTVAERHNAYAWVKPDATACHLCGKKEYITPVDGFQVKDCDRCERPVCQECAEVDYDLQGDPGKFVNTQWQCGPQARKECLVGEFETGRDEIMSRLADNLEAVDRKYGVGPYDYSALKGKGA